MKVLYLAARSLDPKGTGQQRWVMRWKPILNVIAVRSTTACPKLLTCNYSHRQLHRPRKASVPPEFHPAGF